MTAHDEGIRSTPPPIPPAAIELGVTEANVEKTVQLKLPDKHWSHDMQAGGVKIENGVVFEHQPKGRPQRPLSVEVPLKDQPKFALPEFDGIAVDSQKMRNANKAAVEWLGQYYGRSLTSTQRGKLVQLYLAAHAEGAKLGVEALRAKTQTARESLRQQGAKISASILIEERKLFKANTQAQVDRYGSPLIAQSAGVPNQQRLEAALVGILRGDYILRPSPKNVHNTAGGTGSDRVATAIATIGTSFRVRTGLLAAEGSTSKTYTKETPLTSPDVVGYEGRLYLAEHDAADVDWEEEFGIDGMFHTSIIGGVWQIQREDVEVRTYEIIEPLGMPASESALERRPLIGNLLSTRRERRTRAIFAGWLVANGAASTYFADDDLTLFGIATFANYAGAQRWVQGLTPTSGGKYYPIRGCAYSIGNYGLHWVCHQTANAFASRKWGYLPVQYAVSWVQFGPYGLLGVCERKDMWGVIHHGCVPGSQCYYNVVPPYAEPALAQVEEALMDGHGYGLDIHWNPKLGQWVWSGANYSSKAPPIPGWNETLSVDPIP